MKVIHKPISFNLETVLKEELPFMSAFYRDAGELRYDVKDLLGFPVKSQAAMPFYTIKESSTYKLNAEFEAYYAMMLDALKIAFREKELLYKFFDCAFLRKHGARFVGYAEATWINKHPALYGRFDACFDPETEELLGIYEFNGDTPVMLFESVNLQARFSGELYTDQYNNWWEIFNNMFCNKYKNVAVVCGTDYVEDMATCETLAQAFKEANPLGTVNFLDIKELDYDHMNVRKPWIARGSDTPFDAVYILSPWEEMVDNFPAMLNHWNLWMDNVHLFEPAWRWFLAHKGMTALCTYLVDTYPLFGKNHKAAVEILLPTYLQGDFNPLHWDNMGDRWVEKPVIGRLSNNIKIWNDGEVESDTGGFYSDESTVFQLYCPPRKVKGRNNFILGMWMCAGYSASMCAREFDTEVLSIANERFIPHIVVAD